LQARVKAVPADLPEYRCGDGKFDDPAHCDQLARVAIEMRIELLQLFLCRTPVTLSACADQAKSLRRSVVLG
jgi:hypothetical protein